MAIIGKIRERSTLVLIIVGGAIMAFVLSDLFSSQTGGGQRGPIHLAEVNGEKINPQEFDIRVQESYENFKNRSQAELDEASKSQLREAVWNEFLSDMLLGKEMNQLGIKVTTKELFDMVQGENPHPQVVQVFSNPQTGEFNSAAVVQFLQTLTEQDDQTRKQWIDFEKALKRNQQLNKYYLLIKKGVYTPSELAKKQHNDNNSSVSFRYIYKPYSALNDSLVEMSEADIKAYYEDHKEDYEQEASHKITYAYFPVVPSDEDKESTKNWVDDVFDKFKATENDSLFVNANSDERFDPAYYTLKNIPAGLDSSFWNMNVGDIVDPVLLSETYYIRKIKSKKFAPDSVKASHILISTNGRKEADAEALADSLLAVIQSGASTLKELVRFSEDQQSAQDSGNVGWMIEPSGGNQFIDTAFASKTGDVKKVKTQFGFHIMEITEQTEPTFKIQVATIKREILPGKETFANLFNQANSFSINATDIESFKNLANEQNLQQRVAVLRENDNFIQGIAASREAVRWVREASEGDVSEAYDVDDAFIVAVVDEVNAEGASPLEKVRNRVEYLLRLDKKAEQFIGELSSESSLDDVASNAGLFVENVENVSFSSPALPDVGLEPKVVATAVSLEQGQKSKPIQGNNGVFVVEVENKQAAIASDVSVVRNSITRNVNARVENGAVLTAIKEKADIADNRSKFY